VFAVAGARATPEESVVTDVDASVAEAPEDGTENVTVTPADGLPTASDTIACNGFMN
jgi:hypothetical protein